MSLAENDPRLIQTGAGVKGALVAFKDRITGGELGSLPVVIGLIVIWTIFYSQNDRFLSSLNLTNLLLQVASVGTISVGVYMVLLLGEVDLSVGSVSGVTAAALVVLNVNHHYSAPEAIAIALVMGCAIGAVQGFFFTRFGVPSFVVTLAGLIGWQGLQLKILGLTGTINISYTGGIAKLTTYFFSNTVGWIMAAVAIILYVGAQLWETRTRTKAGLRPRGLLEIVIRSVVVGALLLGTVAILNDNKGVPLAVLIFVGFIVFFDILTRRTRYGRHLFAVGGNAEAARRAGINVNFIRMSAFMIAGTMAAAGGVLAAARLDAVTQSSGGSDVLLDAIAAAVIGGTSLFGGRGSAYSALLGMLVIGSISNGLDLLGNTAATKFMITGAVLLAAVTIDALGRRGRQASGRS